LVFKFGTIQFSNDKNQTDSFDDTISFINQLSDCEYPIIADGGHIFKYYLNSDSIVALERFSKVDPGFYERVDYEYKDVTVKIKNKEYCAIVIAHAYKKGQLRRIEEYGYKREDLGKYIVFFDDKD
jgi:hypothetical protein